MKIIFTLFILSIGVLFAQNIDAVDGTTIIAESGGTIYDSGGAGGNYGSSEDYSVTLTSNCGLDILIDVTFLDGENIGATYYDYLTITGGAYANQTITATGNYVVSGGTVTLRWRSDSGVQNGGFAVDFSVPAAASIPAGTFTQLACQTDLSYDVEVEITSLNGASGGDILVDGLSVLTNLGIGTHTINISGSSIVELVSSDDPGNACSPNTFNTRACTNCDFLSATFGSATACSGGLYNVNINITGLGTTQTLRITDGTTDYYTNITSTGSFSINNIDGTEVVNLYVVDQNDINCFLTESYAPCDICASSGLPADDICSAPFIDLSEPFFGSTSCSYTAGGSGNGCGTIQNDSWLKFVASDTQFEIDWEIIGGVDCADDGDPITEEGIQISLLELSSCSDAISSAATIDCINPTGGIGNAGNFNPTGMTIGETYYIRIDGYAGDECDYSWTPISGVAIDPPNDECPDALPLTCGGVTVTTNNILATTTGAPSSSCTGDAIEQGLWFTVTGNGGDIVITTDYASTNFDTEINVYTSSDQTCSGAFSCVGGDNDGGSGTKSTYTISNSVNGQTYYIYVDGNNDDQGQFEIGAICTTPACDAEAGTWN